MESKRFSLGVSSLKYSYMSNLAGKFCGLGKDGVRVGGLERE